MRVYHREGRRPACGYWNGSPVEIGITDLVRQLPDSETRHCHPFREYYIILRGNGRLMVEGDCVELTPNMVGLPSMVVLT